MTQQRFDRITNKMFMLIKVLIIVCSIQFIALASIIVVIMNIRNNDSDVNHNDPAINQTNIDEQQIEDVNIIFVNDMETLTLSEKYASVFDWQKYCGDFGEDQLYFLNTQCEKYNIPMEIMLSLICTESGFRSTAKASSSSASGYCQVIKGTAKWVYEDLLKYGKYDTTQHTEIMTTNWKLNIEISCRLMYSLYHNNGQSWENAIRKYYGSTTASENDKYLNKVNTNMCELFNLTTANFT